jgi:oligoendopeptidase F
MLPRWDLTPFYPSIESPEFGSDFDIVLAGLDELRILFDHHAVGGEDGEEPEAQAFEEVLAAFNSLLERIQELSAYLYMHVSTDSYDETAQARHSEFQSRTILLKKLSVRFTSWIGRLDLERILADSDLAREHEFMLRKAKIQARHLMAPGEEGLAAELRPSGSLAWTKLHGNFTSRLQVQVELAGETKKMPMSAVRNLAYDPDREVRRRAYEAELAAWKEAEVPIAAALNGVKGETVTLSARRGWADPLDQAVFEANMDRGTLEAMLEAARESFPTFRRYLKAKAGALGLHRLAWYDLFAPLGEETREWPYDEAERFVAEQFATYSPKMAALALRSARERWVDAEPRDGKRDGAYCIGVKGDVSRIMMNYKPSYGSVSTLAHELGHAYHNLCLADKHPLQQHTPMTLAETASIFCETIVKKAVLSQVDEKEGLAILEATLQGGCQVVVDITSRYLFEQGALDKRRGRELSAGEFCNLMEQAQRDTYGDGLADGLMHPYMWAAKPHYYGSTYYNFPYMFGLLFGLGLYARFREEPEAFRSGFDDMLGSTGMAESRSLAARFGLKIDEIDFWRASLKTLEEDVDEFVRLANG